MGALLPVVEADRDEAVIRCHGLVALCQLRVGWVLRVQHRRGKPHHVRAAVHHFVHLRVLTWVAGRGEGLIRRVDLVASVAVLVESAIELRLAGHIGSGLLLFG